MSKGNYKCYFHPGKRFDVVYIHFRATDAGLCRVVGVCEECIDAYGAYSNPKGLLPSQMYSFTDEYMEKFPRLKEVSAFRKKRGV